MRELPAELIQLVERFDGGSLFNNTEHPWYIKPLKDYDYDLCEIVEFNQYFTSFINLKGNRCIAFGDVYRDNGELGTENYQSWDEWWIVVGKPVLVKDENNLFENQTWILKPEETKVIAKGISQLFERIIQAEGRYYFDAEDFVPDESVFDLD